MKLKSLCCHILWRTYQNMGSIQFKKVRTFPHASDFSWCVFSQNSFKFPFFQVWAGKQHHLPFIFFAFIPHDQIIFPIFFPDLRITKINLTASLRQHIPGDYRILRWFFIGYSVAKGNALVLSFFPASVRFFLICNSGIDKHMSVSCLNSASGKASFFVIFLIWRQSHRLCLPFYHIIRYAVSPVHRTPADGIWMILIKQMHLSFIYREPVGIIDPACRSRNMKNRFLSFWHLIHLFILKSSCFC